MSSVRILSPWYVVEFLNSYACTVLLVCIPYFIQAHYGSSQGTTSALWVMAAYGAAYVPFALLAGRITDRWGPRRVVVRATLLAVPAAASGLLVVYYPSLWLLALVLNLFNLCNTAGWPALESGVSRSPVNVPLGARMGIYNLSWSAGGMLAFATADLIMGPSNARRWEFIFLVPAASCALSALLAATLTIPQSMLAAAHAHAEADADTATVPPHRAQALLLAAWIGNTMAYVGGEVLIAVMPRVCVEHASLGTVWTLLRIAGFALCWLWTGWHYKARYLVAAYVLFIGSFLALLVGAHGRTGTPLAILLPAQVVFGLAVAFLYANSIYYAMHVSSGGGEHAGIHEAVIGLGIAIGCAAGAVSVISGAPTLRPIAAVVGTVLALGGIAMTVVARRKSAPVEQRT